MDRFIEWLQIQGSVLLGFISACLVIALYALVKVIPYVALAGFIYVIIQMFGGV